jgi:small-conductance mechanosensitive channel
MTDKTNDPIQDDVAANAEVDQQTESVDELKSQIARLEAEATKHRKVRQQVEKERNELREKTKSSQDEDYKTLYQTTLDEKSKLHTHVKTQAVNSAVEKQLTKLGVNPALMEAALKLVDHSMVDFDIESGVDSTGVTAAGQKFKSTYSAFFEKPVKGADVKTPGSGASTDNANTMTRSEFDRLDPHVRAERMKKGWKLTD